MHQFFEQRVDDLRGRTCKEFADEEIRGRLKVVLGLPQGNRVGSVLCKILVHSHLVEPDLAIFYIHGACRDDLRLIRHPVKRQIVNVQNEVVSLCVIVNANFPLQHVILQLEREGAKLRKLFASNKVLPLVELELCVLSLREVREGDHVPLIVKNGVELNLSLIANRGVHYFVSTDFQNFLNLRQLLCVDTQVLHGNLVGRQVKPDAQVPLAALEHVLPRLLSKIFLILFEKHHLFFTIDKDSHAVSDFCELKLDINILPQLIDDSKLRRLVIAFCVLAIGDLSLMVHHDLVIRPRTQKVHNYVF